jgi:predicted Zn finger-like uncharacterized protein
MRLICPNCDAEYQVDDAAIPETGRDVQCSNCGHAWFQLPAEAELAREAEEQLFGSAPEELAPEPAHESAETAVSAEDAPPSPAVDAPDVVMPEPAMADAQDTATIEETDPAPVAVASRQSVAESVLSVLREEAEREAAVRREEDPVARSAAPAGSVETQTELGLDGAGTLAAGVSAAARHIARLKGTDPDLPQMADAKSAARRDLLPDIEEINSTLRANSERAQADLDDIDALPDLKPRRRGFRSGFVLMMILAVVLAMAYIMAPRIVAQIPGAAPAMRGYVAAVDSGRLWLDGIMQSASGSLRGISGDGN